MIQQVRRDGVRTLDHPSRVLWMSTAASAGSLSTTADFVDGDARQIAPERPIAVALAEFGHASVTNDSAKAVAILIRSLLLFSS